MIPFTGEDEGDLRQYWASLAVKPPLVGLVRQAVREFLVRKSREPRNNYSGVSAEWVASYRKKHPPLVIIPRDK